MPIAALILSTLAFWFIYWFIRLGGIDQVHAKFAHRKEEARRAAARERERTTCLRAIDDPRDAAIILMLIMARVAGDPTREQIATIEKLACEVLGLHGELTERMTQARFIASRAESFAQAAGLFSDLFNKRLTAHERRQLVSMLEEVAGLDRPCEEQREGLELLRRRLGLAPAR
jgi:uncharacterized tellurite resistance protein B-like protein